MEFVSAEHGRLGRLTAGGGKLKKHQIAAMLERRNILGRFL